MTKIIIVIITMIVKIVIIAITTIITIIAVHQREATQERMNPFCEINNNHFLLIRAFSLMTR